MHKVQLTTGTKFKLENNIYKISKRFPNSTIEAIDEVYGDTKIFTIKEIMKYISSNILHFEVKGKNTTQSDDAISTTYLFDDIESHKYKDEAIFRYEIIKPLINNRFLRSRANVDSRVMEVNSWKKNQYVITNSPFKKIYKVSRSSIYRWIQAYEESNGDFRSLVPSYDNCGGKNKSRIPDIIMDFIFEAINDTYIKQKRITIEELRSIVTEKIVDHNEYSKIKLECPPLSTFARYVSKIPQYVLIAGRIGKKTAERGFRPIGDGVGVSYPLERVEIDHTPIDVLIIDENGNAIRPYLIMAIDKLTRYPLGFSIGLSNGVGWPETMECIRHMLSDKSYVKTVYPYIKNDWDAYGIPSLVVIDNGLEFKNNASADACYQVNFEIQYCPPKKPEWKGSIERFFRTLNTGLFHTLPGTTRSNPQQLGDENPLQLAKLNFSTFLALVHIWIIDVYSQSVNNGAGGIPHKLWQIATEKNPVSLPSSFSEIATLLGRVAYRQINRQGVELANLHYNSNDLFKFFLKFNKENNGARQSFKVKYDPNNIGEIYIYDHLVNKNWIKAQCTNQDYANDLTEWEHNEIQKHARNTYGRVNEYELCKSKALIRQMMENGINYTAAQIARAKKINSRTEIQRSNGSIENSQVYIKSSNYISTKTTDLSNLGQPISVNTPSVFLEALNICNVSEPDNSVVNIHNLDKKQTLRKSEKMNPDNDTDDLDNLDYTGFGVTNIDLKE